jgi:hypothetical protein
VRNSICSCAATPSPRRPLFAASSLTTRHWYCGAWGLWYSFDHKALPSRLTIVVGARKLHCPVTLPPPTNPNRRIGYYHQAFIRERQDTDSTSHLVGRGAWVGHIKIHEGRLRHSIPTRGARDTYPRLAKVESISLWNLILSEGGGQGTVTEIEPKEQISVRGSANSMPALRGKHPIETSSYVEGPDTPSIQAPPALVRKFNTTNILPQLRAAG